VPKGSVVVELYGGVGVIGLNLLGQVSLRSLCLRLVWVEVVTEWAFCSLRSCG
jgi:hypothetical protein